jgi:gliding motility-associated-like protein
VTINPLPTATVNSPTVCAGTNATVTATPGVVGTYSYAWAVPATATNPGNAVSFTATVSGTYSVILTNTSTSCVSTSAAGTVTINPLPIITLSPNDPTTCNGTDGFITVNGTGTGTLTWTGAAAGTVSSVTLPYSIPTLASGSYNVTFTNTTTACVSSLVSTILNNPNAPVINAMPNLVTCGTPIQLMNSNITGTNLTSAVGYYSSPNGVGQIVDGTTYNSPTPVTTIYVYNANGICSAQISFTVTVNTIPTVTVNSTAVCAGINATVTASPGVAGTYSYAWTVPNGATAPGSVASFSTTVAGTYSVIITNTATNCASTSASGIVTVNPLPTVTVNSPIICAGAAATITATPGVTEVYNYAWTVPNGVTAPGNVATFSTTIAGTYSVIITNSTTNCVSTSASGTVTVNPLPTATVNSPSICAGTPATVTASPGVAGTYSYAWTVPTTATNPGDVANFQTTVAGIYSVILTNTTTLCLSASASGTVTVNALPTATVNSPTVCAGTNATVTASPGVAATYNYAWTVPSGATAPGNVATFQTTIAGTYSVILTDPTTLCISAIASGIVTVNPLPTVTVNSPTICADATATITATTGIAATYSYAWTVPSGVTAPGDVASFSTTIAGTYSVIITNTTTACFSTSASGIVTVNALPTATIAGNVTLCQGETQPTITFTGANATAPYIFTYTINGGINQTITSIGNTATLTNSTAIVGSYSYDLVSVQDASTTACSQLQSGTATITVNPSPTATISGNATVCVGEPDQIVTFNGAAGTAPYTFSYTENGVLQTLTSIGNSATIIIPANSAGVYNFNLLSVQDASQTACSQNQSGIVNVTINPIPTVAAGANLIICYGETVILNGAGATTYTWDNGVTNGVIFTPEIGTLSYTVTGTTAAGCTNSDVLDITVNSLPNPSFLPNVNLGCAPLEVTITNTTPNATNCVWTISDGSVFTNCGPITTTFEQSGCYDITLTTTDANNCTNSFIATNIICVEDSPNASFSPSGTSLSTQFTNVYFENNTTGANQYSWNFGDDADLTNEENPIHSFPEESGNYLVTLIATSPNGCIDSTSLNINIYEDLLFYVPNTFTPDFDNFNQVFQPIFTTGFDPYDFTLLIFNRWGEIVFESHDATIGWNGSFGNNGQIGNVQEGTYTWKIEFKAFDNDYRKVVLGSVNLLR